MAQDEGPPAGPQPGPSAPEDLTTTTSSSPEEDFNDCDSALGSDISSVTQSVTSSIMDYPYEYGRRYHAYEAGSTSGPGYHLPNDEEELSRLDLQHRVWQLTIGGPYRAPISPEDIQNVMDIGTGSGIWAIEFADEHPNCNIIGTDLSPVQPTAVPPNCRFIVDDADADVEDWPYPQMDYIHSRLLVAGLKNWEAHIKRIFENLKPGGWVELQEVECPLKCEDGSASPDEPLMKWSSLLAEAAGKVGCDFQVQNKLKGYLGAAGFTNITREDYKWPIGPWNDDQRLNEIGTYMLINATEMLSSCRLFFLKQLDWTPEELEVFLAECRASIKDSKKHQYFAITVHYAQKPL